MTAFYAVYFTTDHYTIPHPKSQYVRTRKNKKEAEKTRTSENFPEKEKTVAIATVFVEFCNLRGIT